MDNARALEKTGVILEPLSGFGKNFSKIPRKTDFFYILLE